VARHDKEAFKSILSRVTALPLFTGEEGPASDARWCMRVFRAGREAGGAVAAGAGSQDPRSRISGGTESHSAEKPGQVVSSPGSKSVHSFDDENSFFWYAVFGLLFRSLEIDHATSDACRG